MNHMYSNGQSTQSLLHLSGSGIQKSAGQQCIRCCLIPDGNMFNYPYRIRGLPILQEMLMEKR